MRRNAIWILAISALVAISGCGGNNEGFRGQTPFTGSYIGPWHTADGSHTGYMTLTVADDSEMAGTYFDQVSGEKGRVKGATHPDGLFNATFTDDATGSVSNLSGIMAGEGGDSGNNKLSGDGTYTRSGTVKGITFDLAKSVPSNPFEGAFHATWTETGGTIGSFDWTVSSTGLITGLFNDESTGETGSVVGVVDANGHFFSTWRASVGGGVIEADGTMGVATIGTTTTFSGTGTWTRQGQNSHGFTFTSS